MKLSKPLMRALCLLAAALFSASIIAPAFAAVSDEAELPGTRGVYSSPYEELLSEQDREKLLAFWSIVNGETDVSNGEACFISDYPSEWLDEIGGSEYGGTAMTPLVSTNPWYDGLFDFRLWYELNEEEPSPGGAPGETPCMVWPDLYGELDLSGTAVLHFYSLNQYPDPEHPLHISRVCLDDCSYLWTAVLYYAEHCTEFSAKNCPELRSVILLDDPLERIEFGPTAFGEDIGVYAFGQGSVGIAYRYYYDEPTCRLYANPIDAFLGWYKDGVLIGEELECDIADGGNYAACYGGDADGNGSVTVTDAIMVLREAMGIGRDGEVSPMLDVNGNGSVDVSDAIMILRFAMGII